SDFAVALKGFLVGQLGWIVKGSGDGSAGAMDGVDRITSVSAFSSASAWFVLAPPSDDVQLLFDKNSQSSGSHLGFVYNPGNDYTGGSSAEYPTSPSGHTINVWRGTHTNWNGATHEAHITGNDDPDAPAWAIITTAGVFERHGAYFAPLTQ